MADKPDFDIPQSMRDIAERNIDQAREAYERFMDMAKKAQAMTPTGEGAVGAGTDRLQRKALDFAEENAEASFEFASQLSQASDMTEALRIQQQYAQDQMKSYIDQTKSMTDAMTKLAGKAQSQAENQARGKPRKSGR